MATINKLLSLIFFVSCYVSVIAQDSLNLKRYEDLKKFIEDSLKIKESIKCDKILFGQFYISKNFYPDGIPYGNFNEKFEIQEENNLSDSIFCIDRNFKFDKNLRLTGNLFNVISKEYTRTRLVDKIGLLTDICGGSKRDHRKSRRFNLKIDETEYNKAMEKRVSEFMVYTKIYFHKKIMVSDKFDTYILSFKDDEYYSPDKHDSITSYDRGFILLNTSNDKLLSFAIISIFDMSKQTPEFIYTNRKEQNIFRINSTEHFLCSGEWSDSEVLKLKYSFFRINEYGFIEILD